MTLEGIPGGPWTVARLEEEFPAIRWREPIPVTVLVKRGVLPAGAAGPQGQVLVCRVCVANEGLKAQAVAEGRVRTFDDRAGFLRHLDVAHNPLST